MNLRTSHKKCHHLKWCLFKITINICPHLNCQLLIKGPIKVLIRKRCFNFFRLNLNLNLLLKQHFVLISTTHLMIMFMSKYFICIFRLTYTILMRSVCPSPPQTETGQRLSQRSAMTGGSQWRRRTTHEDLTGKQRWTDRPSVWADA